MMDFDSSSRYVPSRLSVWCPICGAAEGKACKTVGGLRLKSHDAYASGTVHRPQPVTEDPFPQRSKPSFANRPRWAMPSEKSRLTIN